MAKWSDKEAAVKALERNGKVDPRDLIEAARDPSHPCHGDFTWDIQTAAAERWRDQARYIIRQCKFEIVVGEVTTPVVHYVASPKEESDEFVSLPKMRGTEKTLAVLAAEVAMLHGVAARVYGIALAKKQFVGDRVVSQLDSIRAHCAAVKEEMK